MSAPAATEEHLRALVDEYVLGGRLMQIATSGRDGQPHMAHVWYAATEDLELIFMSSPTREHSRHIEEGSRVAGGIVDIALEGLGQPVCGVTFEGRAVRAGDADLDRVYQVYADRWPHFREIATPGGMRSGQVGTRLYQVRPEQVVLFDSGRFPEQPRHELRLTDGARRTDGDDTRGADREVRGPGAADHRRRRGLGPADGTQTASAGVVAAGERQPVRVDGRHHGGDLGG